MTAPPTSASSLRPVRMPGILAAVLLAAALAGFLVSSARAQIEMEIKLPRRSFILYEPLVATVSITNLAGRDITLEDVGNKQWFNVEVFTLDGAMLSPYDPDYKLQPLSIPAGQTVKRLIDLTPLFPIRDMGTHRVRANVYMADTDKFYYSNYSTFELTDGKLIWRQTVGVPGSGALRQMSLLTYQLSDKLVLYARVRDEAGDTVYTTQSLGRLILTGSAPEQMLDRDNNLHVLQEAQPSAYLYTEISPEGERLTQKAYVKAGQSRPNLAKMENGSVGVRGGQVQVATAQAANPGGATARQPKLSDRPAGLPLPAPNTDGREFNR